MNKIIRKKFLWVGLILLGLLLCILSLLHDYLMGRQAKYGSLDKAGIVAGAIFIIIGSILFLFERYWLYQKKFFSAKVYFWEALLVSILFISLAMVGGISWKEFITPDTLAPWSIGIYQCSSNEPFEFTGEGINNPVLTAKDITDVKAGFVADPFLIYEGQVFYMFFEVFNSRTRQGDIGLAISKDGISWNYQQIVLDEPCHLAYPCVFKWNGEYYMLLAGAYYKTNHFPTGWTFIKTLNRKKDTIDATIFNYKDTWWLLSATGKRDTLELDYADTALGPWLEHPKNPIISGDANKAAPGGQVVVFDNRLVRYAQDVEPYYGNQVWAFEVTKLTPEDYQERQVGQRPILKGYDNWNTRGMHQISPVRIGPEKWIAAVDGY